jgi:hypothetical protein
MAIQQTVTATKAGSAYSNLEEAMAAYSLSANADALKAKLLTAIADGDFVPTSEFDAVTQSLTIVRTWDQAAYEAFVADNSETQPAAKVNLEADGWTVTQSIATV